MYRNLTSLEAVDSSGLSVVVLAGGSSRRMGSDKSKTAFGGGTILNFQLEQIPNDCNVVVVGETIYAGPRVTCTREDPPGGGPVAALASGLQLVNTPAIVLLAVDTPFAIPHLLQHTLGPNSHALIPRENGGKVQFLAGLYRSESLRHALEQLGSPINRSMRELTGHLQSIDYLELGPENTRDFMDIDTPQDLMNAREYLRTHPRVNP